MDRVYVNDVAKHTGQTVRLNGWVQTVRDQGSLCFLMIRDVTGVVQAVATRESGPALDQAKHLSLESVVRITGLAKEEKQAPGGLEVAISQLDVLSSADPELPIPVVEKDENETDINTRLDWRWLDLRKPQKQLIQLILTAYESACRDYWLQHHYIQIHSPKLMSTPSESGAELFEVKYFDRKAYLAQSPQFYKQMAMAAGFERVFEIGPVFRAEPSFTTRHATEFTGYDAEISFIESHETVMTTHEEILIYALTQLKEQFGEAIKQYFGQAMVVPSQPFPRITMAEAKQLLQAANVPSEREGDLSPEEERRLSEIMQERHQHEFVFVIDYPIAVRPFYHMRHDDDPALTKSFDLLWKGVELTTGAQREHRYDVLVEQLKEKGLTQEPLQFYLNFFRYGCPPHGGYGHGPERFIMKLLDLESIREVSYLYRGVKRLTP